MLNPCVELCYQKYGKDYTPKCDKECEFAKVICENRELKKKLKELEKGD